MRRTTAAAAAALLAWLAGSAGAAAPPKPVTLFFHGDTVVGEADSSAAAASYLPMSTQRPSGEVPKSKQLPNYGVGPDTACAGDAVLPVWVGGLRGTVSGKAVVTFDAATIMDVVASGGARVLVQVWADVSGKVCRGSAGYRAPIGEAFVTMPLAQGTVRAVVPIRTTAVARTLMVQLTPKPIPPFAGRVLYDATSVPSSITIACQPARNAKGCS